MLPKEDRKGMLLRFYNDDSPLIDRNQEQKPKAPPSKLEVEEPEKSDSNANALLNESDLRAGHHDGNTASEDLGTNP